MQKFFGTENNIFWVSGATWAVTFTARIVDGAPLMWSFIFANIATVFASQMFGVGYLVTRPRQDD